MKKALMLKTVNARMESYGGFLWPNSGKVVAPDWNPEPVCGGGLHGLLWGEGGVDHLDFHAEAKWLVCEIDADAAVSIDGDKIKVPECTVVHCGDRASATQYLYERARAGTVIQGLVYAGGNESTVTGGNWSTVTGGNESTVTGGNESTVTGGYRSTVTGGDWSTVTGGDRSTVTGGDRSVLQISWWDGLRKRIATAYVGEDGIEAGVKYGLDDAGQFKAVEGGK